MLISGTLQVLTFRTVECQKTLTANGRTVDVNIKTH